MILDNRNDCDQVKNDVSHRQWGKNSGFHSFLSFPAFLLRGGEKAAYLTCRGTSSRGKNFHCQANATFHFSLEETILLKVNIFLERALQFLFELISSEKCFFTMRLNYQRLHHTHFFVASAAQTHTKTILNLTNLENRV